MQELSNGAQGEGGRRVGISVGVREEGGEGEVGRDHLPQCLGGLLCSHSPPIQFSQQFQATQCTAGEQLRLGVG